MDFECIKDGSNIGDGIIRALAYRGDTATEMRLAVAGRNEWLVARAVSED